MERDLAIPIPGDRPLVAFCVQHLHRMGEPYMCNVRICIYFCWARIAFCDAAHHLRSHFFLSCCYFFPVSHEQTMISSRNVWHSGDSRTHKIHTHAVAVCHYLPKVIVFVPYFFKCFYLLQREFRMTQADAINTIHLSCAQKASFMQAKPPRLRFRSHRSSFGGAKPSMLLAYDCRPVMLQLVCLDKKKT